MSNEPIPPDPALSGFEAALGSIAPAPSRLDRDRVMYRAGQASAHPGARPPRVWPAVAAGLGLALLWESSLLARRPAERVVERIVYVDRAAPGPVAAIQPLSPSDPRAPDPMEPGPALGSTPHDRLAGQVVRYGLEGLPASPAAAWNGSEPWPASSGELLREELRKLLEPGDAS